MSRLTHFDPTGAARMVDVSDKPETARTAIARGWIAMAPATLALVTGGTAAKGDVLGVARLAGIMAAKRTAELIPLCHPLPLAKALTVYDMLKAADRAMVIGEVRLALKDGGKSGRFEAP